MALVDSLLTLYRVDSQVRGLRSRLDSAQRYFKTQEEQLTALVQQQQEMHTRKRQVQAALATLELEIKSIDERLEKLRGELNSAPNNKQYTAVLTELNTVKASRTALEDRVLSHMEQLETIDAQFETIDGQIAERTKVRDLANSQYEERKTDVGARLSELEHEHEKAAAVIPANVLQVFEEVADLHEGEAMAAVEEIDRKHREYACGACNMHLPFELVSKLSSKTDMLVRCAACGRLLFLQEAMPSVGAKK
jgi:predicted  nucleic acid-binding Zn-ribbon protein